VPARQPRAAGAYSSRQARYRMESAMSLSTEPTPRSSRSPQNDG
jgi:hypothetical protein